MLRAIYIRLPIPRSYEDYCCTSARRLLLLLPFICLCLQILYNSAMKYLLLSFLFLPFAVLGTPVSSAASSALLAAPTSSVGNSSIPGLVGNGTTLNGTQETPKEEEYCPAPTPGHHIEIIDLGFRPFTVRRTLYISGMSRAVTYGRLGYRLVR